MYFDVYDYPKLIAAAPAYSFGGKWVDVFKDFGFKTYRYDSHLPIGMLWHWLDDYEYTWFLLRYS